MSKRIGLVVLFLCLTFSISIQAVFAQGGTVSSVRVDHPADKPCATLVYFELDGFMPQTTLYAQSLGYTEVSCETGQQNSSSWPKSSIGVTDSNGHYTHGSYVGGVSGNYSLLFTDNVTSVTFTYQTNERGDIISSSYQQSGQSQAPQVNPPVNPPVNPVQSGGQYPQGHEGVEWGGIHFGNYCGAFGQSEYNDGAHGKSWGCGGQTLDHNTICRNIYGDALPFAQYKGDGLGDVYCGTAPSAGNAGWAAPPDVLPNVSDKWCAVQAFDTTPSSDHFDPGTQVSLFGRGGNCQFGNNGLPRATRFSIDGKLFGEKQQSENYDTWDTSKYSLGTHTVCFMVASDRDTTWEHRDEQCRTYTIGSANQTTQPDKPNPPVVSNDCPGALPALVQPGTIAIVNTLSSDNLNVRSSPHVAKETKIDQLAPRSTFTVVDGPVCAEGYRWWQIGYNGKSGYAAEAGARAYNFVPNGTTLPYDPTGLLGSQPSLPITQPTVPDTGSNLPAPTGGNWVTIAGMSAPFSKLNFLSEFQCVTPGVRYSKGVTDAHEFYYQGHYYENAQCDLTLGKLFLDANAWGGSTGDGRDVNPSQTFGTYVEMQGVYIPDFTGTLSVEVSIAINGKMFVTATPLKMLMPNVWDEMKSTFVKGALVLLGQPEIAIALEIFEKGSSLLSGSRAYVGGQYYLKVSDQTGEIGADFYQVGQVSQIGAEYPSPTPYSEVKVTPQVIVLSRLVQVQAGRPIKISFGENTTGLAYGTALSAWTQDPVQVMSISLLKLQ